MEPIFAHDANRLTASTPGAWAIAQIEADPQPAPVAPVRPVQPVDPHAGAPFAGRKPRSRPRPAARPGTPAELPSGHVAITVGPAAEAYDDRDGLLHPVDAPN